MRKELNHSIVIHDGIDFNDLFETSQMVFLLEEPLSIDVGTNKNHWEIGILTKNNGFLISTAFTNTIEVFNGKYDGKFFRYGYTETLDRKAKVLSMSPCKELPVVKILKEELERIKKHPYKLLIDNCHNNAIYQYMNIIEGEPPIELLKVL